MSNLGKEVSESLFEQMKTLNEVSMTGYQAGKTAGYEAGFKAGVKACQKGGLNLNIEETYGGEICSDPNFHLRYACTDDDYEPGAPIGYGRTEAEAVAEYFEKVQDRKDAESQTEENLILKTADPQTGILEE